MTIIALFALCYAVYGLKLKLEKGAEVNKQTSQFGIKYKEYHIRLLEAGLYTKMLNCRNYAERMDSLAVYKWESNEDMWIINPRSQVIRLRYIDTTTELIRKRLEVTLQKMETSEGTVFEKPDRAEFSISYWEIGGLAFIGGAFIYCLIAWQDEELRKGFRS